jgi:hypothetical protein
VKARTGQESLNGFRCTPKHPQCQPKVLHRESYRLISRISHDAKCHFFGGIGTGNVKHDSLQRANGQGNFKRGPAKMNDIGESDAILALHSFIFNET